MPKRRNAVRQAARHIQNVWRKRRQLRPINHIDPISMEPLLGNSFTLVHPNGTCTAYSALLLWKYYMLTGFQDARDPLTGRSLNRVEISRLRAHVSSYYATQRIHIRFDGQIPERLIQEIQNSIKTAVMYIHTHGCDPHCITGIFTDRIAETLLSMRHKGSDYQQWVLLDAWDTCSDYIDKLPRRARKDLQLVFTELWDLCEH